MEEGVGRRERFDLKDEQKVLAAAHLGDRREGGFPTASLGDFSPALSSLSLAALGMHEFTGDTQASSPELHSQIRKKMAGNSLLPHCLYGQATGFLWP